MKCTCGSAYCGNPNYHYDWCDIIIYTKTTQVYFREVCQTYDVACVVCQSDDQEQTVRRFIRNERLITTHVEMFMAAINQTTYTYQQFRDMFGHWPNWSKG
jgi:hypothetical protein